MKMVKIINNKPKYLILTSDSLGCRSLSALFSLKNRITNNPILLLDVSLCSLGFIQQYWQTQLLHNAWPKHQSIHVEKHECEFSKANVTWTAFYCCWAPEASFVCWLLLRCKLAGNSIRVSNAVLQTLVRVWVISLGRTEYGVQSTGRGLSWSTVTVTVTVKAELYSHSSPV